MTYASLTVLIVRNKPPTHTPYMTDMTNSQPAHDRIGEMSPSIKETNFSHH